MSSPKAYLLIALVLISVFCNLANAEPDLIAWWKFDEGSGSTAYDSVGSNHGTINGAEWTTGQIDGALSFDGVDDYVDLDAHIGDFQNLSTGSVSVWIKKESTGSSGAFFSASDSGDVDSRLTFIKLADGRIIVRISQNGTSKVYWTSTNAVPSGWHHFAYTTNSSGHWIYLDAEPFAGSYTVGSPSTNAFFNDVTQQDNLRIGHMYLNNEAVTHWNGTIDDVRIYDRALCAEAIYQLYAEDYPKAVCPSPANGATGVDPNVVLSWSAGLWASDVNGHDVYLGTDYNDVNDANTFSAEYMGNFDVNSFDPCGLEYLTAYYWRIDEVNESDPNLWKGNVWSFRTWFEANLIAWWKFDEGSGSTAYDSGGSNIGTIMGDANWVPGAVGPYALVFDGNDDYVSIPNSAVFDFGTGDFTISTWFKTSSPNNQHVINFSQYDNNPHIEIYNNWLYAGRIGAYLLPRSFNLYYQGNVNDNKWHHAVITMDNGTTNGCKLYLDGQQRDQGTYSQSLQDWDAIAIGARKTSGSVVYDFDGQIDNVRVYNRALSSGEIYQLCAEGHPKAVGPSPANGAWGVDPNVVLRWWSGKDANSHDVYLGTDYNDVNDANTSSAEYMGNFDVNSFDPCGLEYWTAYYWRIDEVNEANSDVWKGDIWYFSTFALEPDTGTCWDPLECVGQYAPDPLTAQVTGLGGDASCDGTVNFDDLGMLKRYWGETYAGSPHSCIITENDVYCCCTDFNHDGTINFDDLNILKANWANSGFAPSTRNLDCPP